MGQATREAYGEALAKLIVENEKIVVFDADLTKSTKTAAAQVACPERHYNMGIAEANMIGVAAGFAASGYTAFASTFAMFAAGRGWEQIRNSVAYPNLNVKVCGTHSGIAVGEDGVSHQAIEDIALMSVIPGMQVYQPCDGAETKAVIEHVAKIKGPCYVRLGRAQVEDIYTTDDLFDFSRISVLNRGERVAIFATGMLVQASMKAMERLQTEGIHPTIVNISCLKPLDRDGIADVLENHDLIITAEEHSVIGGLGSAISDVSVERCPKHIIKMGIQDAYAESGPFEDLMKKYKLDHEAVYQTVKNNL